VAIVISGGFMLLALAGDWLARNFPDAD
jgi:hypothetical protein